MNHTDTQFSTSMRTEIKMPRGLPPEQGLYDPHFEHDSCGVGFLCHLKGKKSHSIVRNALEMLVNMDHRGGCGCDPNTGDGAGLFLQLPHKFFKAVAPGLGIELPEEGDYAVGMVYLPPDKEQRGAFEREYNRIVAEEGQKVLGWRDVPVVGDPLGRAPRACEPVIRQIFIGRGAATERGLPFERKLYVIRRMAASEIRYTNQEGATTSTRPLSRRAPSSTRHAHHRAAHHLFPRPGAPGLRVRHGARAQPLLDEHVPELAARAALPLHVPQW
jgi:hypothetical protein